MSRGGDPDRIIDELRAQLAEERKTHADEERKLLDHISEVKAERELQRKRADEWQRTSSLARCVELERKLAIAMEYVGVGLDGIDKADALARIAALTNLQRCKKCGYMKGEKRTSDVCPVRSEGGIGEETSRHDWEAPVEAPKGASCFCYLTDPREPVYSAEHDNYYCATCNRGMGNAYHAAARERDALRSPSSCKCRSIQAADERRHFKGCPLRKDLPDQKTIDEKTAESATIKKVIAWLEDDFDGPDTSGDVLEALKRGEWLRKP